MKRVAAFSLVAAAVLPAAAAPQPPPLDRSIVEVLVACQNYDPHYPWQRLQDRVRQGYGAVIRGSQVVTLESLVRHHTLVEVRRAASGEKIEARVRLADPQAGLALLDVPDPNASASLAPLPLAGFVSRSSTVEIVQMDDTAEFRRDGARVIQASVEQLPAAPHSSLVLSLAADSGVDAEGAPVLLDNALAGLVLRYSSSSRRATILPAPMIRRFLDDAQEAPYEGLASAGLQWTPLVDAAKRSSLNVDKPGFGVLVLACLPGTGASESLRPGDVVIEWDGFPVDALGFYQDPDYGRMALPYLILGRRKPGDSVGVRLVRNRAPMSAAVRLARQTDDTAWIPEDLTDEQPPYLVEGGFIIRELSGRYLLAYGAQWQTAADSRLVHLYLTRKHRPGKTGDRVVILSSVLPDPINVAYDHFRDEVVTHVNGRPVRNLRDVFRARETDGSIHRVSLQSAGVELVLDRNDIADANARLAQRYRIPTLRRPPPAR
jgi:hypothetical protein